jgi:hypothetical protein
MKTKIWSYNSIFEADRVDFNDKFNFIESVRQGECIACNVVFECVPFLQSTLTEDQIEGLFGNHYNFEISEIRYELNGDSEVSRVLFLELNA